MNTLASEPNLAFRRAYIPKTALAKALEFDNGTMYVYFAEAVLSACL